MKNRLAVILILLFALSTIKSNAQQFTEYEVKAAYIFNFTKFIKWPASAFKNKTTPYILGIYGNDPFGDILKNIILNRKSKDRKWIVKYYNKPEQIQKCHLLFVSNLNHSELKKVIDQTKKKSILTIGDEIKSFCEQGGIINFSRENTTKRFEINNTAASRVKLNISSKLLMLSKIISNDEIKF